MSCLRGSSIRGGLLVNEFVIDVVVVEIVYLIGIGVGYRFEVVVDLLVDYCFCYGWNSAFYLFEKKVMIG
jgi:hypothetical protein